ncbi:MAG: carboxypeptidase-like regulatory domain-containing protein [Armatimonadota bacterium]
MKRILLPIILFTVVALFLSGCGGSGGNKEISLSGSVTDVAGNYIPGATISIDGRDATKSLMNGAYKVTGLSSGEVNVEASAVIDGKEWTGTRAVDVYADGPTQNMNIVIGPWDELGDIKGAVTDTGNDPLSSVRVIAVARYPQDKAANEASVISKVAITDKDGAYVIDNLPSSITVDGKKEELVYDVIASFAGKSGQPGGFENVTKTATVGADMVTTLNFKLEASDEITPPTPTGWTSEGAIYVISYTLPTSITSRAEMSAYDALKSCISERSSKAVALKNKTARRSPPSGTLIENDVVWYSIWNGQYGIDIPSNLAGFSIYRAQTSNIDTTDNYLLDFVRDPAIVTYSDTSSSLTAGMTYWYGVTSVSTSYLDANDNFNPDAESDMSYPASVTPLGKLTVQSPPDKAKVSTATPTFTWVSLSGARSYKVFIYEGYPILDSLFTPQGDAQRPDHLPVWGESDVVTGTSVTFSDSDFSLVKGQTYYWVVMSSDKTDFDQGDAFAISELRSFTKQ